MITERTRDRGGLALKRMIILVPNSSVIPDNFLFPTSGLCTLYSWVHGHSFPGFHMGDFSCPIGFSLNVIMQQESSLRNFCCHIPYLSSLCFIFLITFSTIKWVLTRFTCFTFIFFVYCQIPLGHTTWQQIPHLFGSPLFFPTPWNIVSTLEVWICSFWINNRYNEPSSYFTYFEEASVIPNIRVSTPRAQRG